MTYSSVCVSRVAGQRVSCVLGMGWRGVVEPVGSSPGGQGWECSLCVRVCLYRCVCSRGMLLFAEWRAQRQQRLSKHTSVCKVCVHMRVCLREGDWDTEWGSVYGTVCEQAGTMSSDGKRFRGALWVSVFSSCCDLLLNEYFHIPPSLHGRSADRTERGLSLHTCDLRMHTHTHTRLHCRLCPGYVCLCVGVCVFTVLLPVCLADERSERGGRDGGKEGMI